MYLTRTLAGHVRSSIFQTPPAPVREKVFCCILDSITAAISGFSFPSAVAARSAARSVFGDGIFPVWFADRSLTLAGAAFCNSIAASALDIDDGHRAARGHPGAAIVPAALTIASTQAAGTDAIVEAILAGYEIAIRVASAQNPAAIKSRQSGRWVGYGAAAATGSLYRSEPGHIAHAMAIAGLWAPNQEANGSSGYSRLTGNSAKEGIAWSVATGLMAFKLAENGFTGPEDILDHASHFDQDRIVSGIGTGWEILGTYFKPYSCCRYIHPAIDAVSEIMASHRITGGDVTSVEVQIFEWALRLSNGVQPTNLIDVQYSLPYCIAIAVKRGAGQLAPLRDDVLDQPDLAEFARHVTLSVDPDLDRRFPAETLARVIVTTRSQRISSDVVTPRGEPTRPMMRADIIAKFLHVTANVLTIQRQTEMLRAFDKMTQGDPEPLFRQLRQPLDTLAG